MTPCIWIEADNNADGSSIAVAAAEAEFSRHDHNGNISIQCNDVMAFDQGDGDPITGATIALTPTEARLWVKSISALLGPESTWLSGIVAS